MDWDTMRKKCLSNGWRYGTMSTGRGSTCVHFQVGRAVEIQQVFVMWFIR